jgi:hypothetical protein
MEGVQAAMTAKNLEPDQWRNREEWHLVSGKRQQLLKNRIDRWIFNHLPLHTTHTWENFCQTGKVTSKDIGKALTYAKN